MSRWLVLLGAALAGAAALSVGVVTLLEPADAAPHEYAGDKPAPEFPRGLDWINTGGQELSLEMLRGRVVLLDFWTYGCINCMHVIPELRRLQREFGDALVVIGVHSAKFANEGRTENIRKVAQRYGREEPIVNDHGFDIWRSYGVRAWPTFMLIDPAGNGIGYLAGEGHYALLRETIAGTIATFERRGTLKRGPLPFERGPGLAAPAGELAFPGKVLAADGRLFIADSNHHRIVVAGTDGRIQRSIGGRRGFRDGPLERAAFNGPQGLAWAGDGTLYVADTLNHAIRRVDLVRGTVSTVAGTGAHAYLREDAYAARETGLNSPWDLLWHDGLLYVAMAGQHQLWTLDPRDGALAAFAGTRREALLDGPRLQAAFNQPSGLALADGTLFVADSEASAVRTVDLATGRVATSVGTGLFDFGDRDGRGDAVRLQHPLGVAVHEGRVLIADTYNGKVKSLDPETREVTTLAAGFDEPGGLSVAGGTAYVADTNHHAVKALDLATGEVREIPIR